MQTAARKWTLVTMVGGLALVLAGASCRQTGPTPAAGNGGNQGSGGTSSSGGSPGSGGSQGSGGSRGDGGSPGSGGSQGSGGLGVGGTNETGGSNDTGGSQNSGGNGDGGSNGDGGNRGYGGSDNTGGSGDGGNNGYGGSDNAGGSGAGGNNGYGGSESTGGSGAGGNNGYGGSDNTGGAGNGGTGGSNSSGLNCSNAVEPANQMAGGVTDFSDYSTNTGKWGSSSNLYGSFYKYAATNSSLTASFDSTAKALHATGSVVAGEYAGIGLSFEVCATVAAFKQVQFSISGSIGVCDLELQIKTFDQQPTTDTPAGGCDKSAGSCYGFPSYKQIVVPSSSSTDVTKALADFSGWSDANAKQVVGLQWQVTGSSKLDGDAGQSCALDFSVTNIKFLP
jgi:hypothetical protein